MQHHAPHPGAAFEGYYNKFLLPSGANLVIVICKVSEAPSRANLVTLTYVPSARDRLNIYQKEIVTDDIQMRRTGTGSHAFILDIPDLGYAKWNDDFSSEFYLQNGDFTFEASVASRVPWSAESCTPEGFFIKLPLPLHWHVQNLAAPSKFHLSISDYNLPRPDTSGEAVVHQEKNWATSFPSAHMWVQCREKDRGFCCAGGKILGVEAFLLGYRSPDLNFDFRPPFALRFLGMGPFVSYKMDWNTRSFELNVQSFRQKIEVQAQAPRGTFFPLSAPFPDGHRANYLNESFQTKVTIKIYESGWISQWRLVREEIFENSSLEFGGEYYPPAGSQDQFN